MATQLKEGGGGRVGGADGKVRPPGGRNPLAGVAMYRRRGDRRSGGGWGGGIGLSVPGMASVSWPGRSPVKQWPPGGQPLSAKRERGDRRCPEGCGGGESRFRGFIEPGSPPLRSTVPPPKPEKPRRGGVSGGENLAAEPPAAGRSVPGRSTWHAQRANRPTEGRAGWESGPSGPDDQQGPPARRATGRRKPAPEAAQPAASGGSGGPPPRVSGAEAACGIRCGGSGGGCPRYCRPVDPADLFLCRGSGGGCPRYNGRAGGIHIR